MHHEEHFKKCTSAINPLSPQRTPCSLVKVMNILLEDPLEYVTVEQSIKI